MRAHIIAWALAIGFVTAGFTLAGCEPEGSPAPVKTVTCTNYGRECR